MTVLWPSQVFKAQWNGAEAAVKILHDQGEKQKTEFLHEATMLKSLRHPNVVDYFGLAFSEKDEVGTLTTLDEVVDALKMSLSLVTLQTWVFDFVDCIMFWV